MFYSTFKLARWRHCLLVLATLLVFTQTLESGHIHAQPEAQADCIYCHTPVTHATLEQHSTPLYPAVSTGFDRLGPQHQPQRPVVSLTPIRGPPLFTA